MNETPKRFHAAQILVRAAQLHIMLSAEGDMLHIFAPKDAVNEKIRAVLQEYKSELIAHLTAQERTYLRKHDEGPLCARCLDIDRENAVEALPEPYTDDLYYCKRHHPALPQQQQQEEGDNSHVQAKDTTNDDHARNPALAAHDPPSSRHVRRGQRYDL
jgi:TubC N-terminal docking domain